MVSGGIALNFGLASMFYKYVWDHNVWVEAQQATATKHMDLACCRRDSAAFQVLVAADEDFLLTTGTDPKDTQNLC
jgi:hypothetical protein